MEDPETEKLNICHGRETGYHQGRLMDMSLKYIAGPEPQDTGEEKSAPT